MQMMEKACAIQHITEKRWLVANAGSTDTARAVARRLRLQSVRSPRKIPAISASSRHPKPWKSIDAASLYGRGVVFIFERFSALGDRNWRPNKNVCGSNLSVSSARSGLAISRCLIRLRG